MLAVPNRNPLDHGPQSQAQHAPSGEENDVNAPAWLEFDWDASVPGFEDPTGAATM